MREVKDWRVIVNEVRAMQGLETPEDKPHAFMYHITITNEGDEVITLLGRKWIVKEDNGEITVVEGEGVVGETPRFTPYSTFSYHSYHVVATSAQVQGTYFGETEQGEQVFTRIPDFSLIVP